MVGYLVTINMLQNVTNIKALFYYYYYYQLYY